MNDDIEHYRASLQTKNDGVAHYRALSGIEMDASPELASVYRSFADVEERHDEFWRERLR